MWIYGIFLKSVGVTNWPCFIQSFEIKFSSNIRAGLVGFTSFSVSLLQEFFRSTVLVRGSPKGSHPNDHPAALKAFFTRFGEIIALLPADVLENSKVISVLLFSITLNIFLPAIFAYIELSSCSWFPKDVRLRRGNVDSPDLRPEILWSGQGSARRSAETVPCVLAANFWIIVLQRRSLGKCLQHLFATLLRWQKTGRTWMNRPK